MKILHIGKYFPPFSGGMENYLRDLMTAQSRQGLVTSALVHRSNLSFKSRNETYQTDECELPVTRAAVWARFLFTPISPTFPWLLRKLIKQQKPDVLHLHMPNVSVFWALFLPCARKIPWVVHWHADVLASSHSPGLRYFYTLYRPFERAVLKRASAIIATSPPYLESSEPLKHVQGKCHVVPLGLDPANLPATASQGRDHDTEKPLRILAVGRLTYYKGFEYLIRATALCKNVEIHLVGKGDQEASLKALAQELKLQERITFHGHLPGELLARQFQACDCLCLPSIERTEAFGMVLLEAMYFGKASIVSNVSGSGMGWVVDDGISGIHVAPENTNALAESLRNLQQNRDKIRTLGGNGRQRFDRLFHIDQSATGVSRIYTQVLESAPTSQ